MSFPTWPSALTTLRTRLAVLLAGRRDQRGAVMPSPVVMLSIVAVALAAVAFVATRGGEPTEREITPAVAQDDPTSSASATEEASEPTEEPTKKPKPPVRRGQTYVVVFNNSGITGLAGTVSAQAADAGWNVVGADNWYGTIPANTVYHPPKFKREAKLLALDLGIERVAPAVEPMQMDRLTVILTGPLDG